MLYDLIFSLNIVLPLFLLIILGYGLKRFAFFNDGFLRGGNKFVFYIALPVTLFRNLYMSDIGELLDLMFIAFLIGMTLIVFLVIWGLSVIFIKDKKILGAFVQGAFRSNFALLGIPLLFNMAGEAGLARAALIVTFVLPLFNIFSILVLAGCSDSGKKVGPLTIAYTVIKNPLIIGIALGMLASVSGMTLPNIIDHSTSYLANMATPLAVICLGAGIVFKGFDKKFKYAVVASILKVIILPIIFIGAGYAFGFRGYDLAALLVLAGTPSAIVGYAMVVQMGGDEYIAGTVIVISTLASAVTLTLFIYTMRILGLLG
ncbi:MAG: AEC family transporter [Defluviitaleaceae bacterium]|nr:AEC family transporter [Defluviitaleaceae bacterium]